MENKEKNNELIEQEKHVLSLFLERHAITKEQYDRGILYLEHGKGSNKKEGHSVLLPALKDESNTI